MANTATAINPPVTTTMTGHGLFLVVNGSIIGAVTSWEPNQSRQITPVFEFGAVTTGPGDVPAAAGEQYENVPGNIGGTEISIARYDLYTSKFEAAFGSFDLTMLSGQNVPIQFREFFQAPDGTVNESSVYYGVWFNKLGRRHDAKGDRIVMVQASAMYTRKRPL